MDHHHHNHQHKMFLQGTIIILLMILNKYGDCFREVTVDKELKRTRGSSVELSCPIDSGNCGQLHSVNWFKGETRIVVVLGNGTNIAPDYRDRLKVIHAQEGPNTNITISNLEVKDEDTYNCDTTFFEPQENCDASRGYRISLSIQVPPRETYILYDGKKINNYKIIENLEEGDEFSTACVVEETRPKPNITWNSNGKILQSEANYSKEEDGIYAYNSEELTFKLSREHLQKDIECRIESNVLDNPISYQLKLDLQVRPTNIHLAKLVEREIVENDTVVLECKVFGARPAANISWTNTSVIIEDNDKVDISEKIQNEDDGTQTTISKLKFNASRFENEEIFRCSADNIVMRNNKEKPKFMEMRIDVLYPPVVKLRQSQLTVNEGDSIHLNCEYEANPNLLLRVRWLRDGEPINLTDSQHYEGGIPDNPTLTIKRTQRYDRGNYTCELTNRIGTSVSEMQIDLDVLYVPTVEVQMIPYVDHVKERDESNVTLLCNIIDGNPPALYKVKWYANSSLLKELPECDANNNNTNSDDLCHVDPSKLLLESIGRGFFFNYSCQGYNLAGWGNKSEDKELVVQYEPGSARIFQDPSKVHKKQSVTLLCHVEDLGYPAATNYVWLRNHQPISTVRRRDYTIELIGLDARGNYSCYATNSAGNGSSAAYYLNVSAPPTFILAPNQYTGVLYSSKNMSLTCRVECYPKCTINWSKDGVKIDFNSTDMYHVTERYLAAEESTGDFESALSILHFNLPAWPNQQFDKHKDNGNYSCQSTSNGIGDGGVTAATYLSIEYAPENTTVPASLNVTEGQFPEEFNCTADGNPEPNFEWKFKGMDGNDDEVFISDKKFRFKSPATRNDSGFYACNATNKHGYDIARIYVNVQYKPSCKITRKEVNEQDSLICTGDGNPDDYGYVWAHRTENETTEIGSGEVYGKSSLLVLADDYAAVTKKYYCTANNTLGAGISCSYEYTGKLAWYQGWDKTTLIIVIASIVAIILVVIIICCIIICICRRRRRQEKYHADASISAVQSVLSYQQPPSSPLPTSTLQITPEVPKSPPKWPLRPGVMVHIKGDTKQNLCANRSNSATETVETSIVKSSSQNVMNANETIQAQTHSAQIPSSSSSSSSTSVIAVATKISSLTSPLAKKTSVSLQNPTTSLAPTLLSSKVAQKEYKQIKNSNDEGAGNERNSNDTNPNNSTTTVTYNNKNNNKNNNNNNNGEINHEQQQQQQEKNLISARVNPNNFKEMTANTSTNILPNVDSSKDNNRHVQQEFEDRPPTLPRRNIMQSKNSTNKNDHSGNSAVELLPRKKRTLKRNPMPSYDDDYDDDDDSDDSTICINNNENSISNGLFEKIFGEIFSRNNSKEENGNQSSFSSSIPTTNTGVTATIKIRNLQSLFGLKRFFIRKDGNCERQQLDRNDSSKSTSSSSNPFTSQHRLKGIRCSGNVVTYKKTINPASKNSNKTVNVNASNNGNNISNNAQQQQHHPQHQKHRETSETALKYESDSTEQIHGKSSTLGDPLTEPGEYENLPFHGLQTAPNKFITPINFNNANVVRVAPRQKLIDNNQYQHHHKKHLQQQHHHQFQYQLQQDASKQITYPISSSTSVSPHNTLISPHPSTNTIKSEIHHNMTVGSVGGVNNINNNSNNKQYSTTTNHYNLNDCFPTSYTAYYSQQHQHRPYAANFQSDKFYTSDYPPYTVQNSTQTKPSGNNNKSVAINNPFLVSNSKKFNTDNSCRTTGHRKKSPESDINKKFYSLKPLNHKKGLHFCSMKPSLANLSSSLTSSSNKCKRHHSFTVGSTGDVISIENYKSSMQQHPLTAHDTQSIKMNFYEPPAYENLTDSIQIHEHNPILSDPFHGSSPTSTTLQSQTTTTPSSATSHHLHHKRHHQHQQQKMNMKDFELTTSSTPTANCNTLTEKERLSIYRSDSGISNSSYECITPVPAPRQLLHKNKSSSSSASSTSKNNKNQTPHYMNLSGGSSTTPTPTTPSTLSLPPFSSDSLNACPPSIKKHHNHHHHHQQQQQQQQQQLQNVSPKCNCNNDNDNNSCYIQSNNDDNKTNNNANKDFQRQEHYHQQQQKQLEQLMNQQRQQNHQSSIASYPNNNNSTRGRKLSSSSLISLEQIPNTNPFLATNSSSSSGFTSNGGNGSLNVCGGGGNSVNGKGDVSSSIPSTTSRCRQHVLVPKELFPPPTISSPPSPSLTKSVVPAKSSSSSSSSSVLNTISNFTNNTSSLHNSSFCDVHNLNTGINDIQDYHQRNNYHHYQHYHHHNDRQNYSQKDNSAFTNKKHQKTRGYTVRPAKFPLRKHHSFHFQLSQTVAGVKLKKKATNYIQNGGPLIFKPFLNENSAFKPISPAKCSNNSTNGTNSMMIASNKNDFSYNNNNNHHQNEINNAPRICGTSLKRHMSNVETYDSSRYNVPDLRNNSRRNESYSEDELGIIVRQRSGCSGGYIGMDDDGCLSSSSNSTVVAKHSHFDQTSTTNTLNSRSPNNDDTSSMTDEFDDLTINSDSEQQFRRKADIRLLRSYRNNKKLSFHQKSANDEKLLETNYASLKYNEANI